MVQFVSASPGLPVMNGIFKVCHWPEPPFLRILPARLFVTTCQKPSAFCLSFLDLLRCFAAVSFRHIQYFFFAFSFFSGFSAGRELLLSYSSDPLTIWGSICLIRERFSSFLFGEQCRSFFRFGFWSAFFRGEEI